MTKGSPESEAVPESMAGPRAVLARVFSGVRRNKKLVAGMLAASMLEVALHQGPLLLIKPILTAFTGGEKEPEDVEPEEGVLGLGEVVSDWSDSFNESFSAWSHQFSSWVGMEFAPPNENGAIIFTASILMMLVAPLGAIAVYFASVLSRFFATKIVVELRDELATHLLHLPLRYYGKERMGQLLSRLTNDTTVLARSFTLVADNLVVDSLKILGLIAIVGFYAPVALIIVVPLVPIMGWPMIRIGKRVQKRSRGSLAAMGDSTESMNQMLSGIRVVKAFQLEDARRADFAAANQTFLDRTKRMLQSKGRSQATVFVAYQCGFALMIFGLSLLLQEPNFEIGDVLQIVAPTSMLYTHIKRVARAYNAMMESAGAMDRIDAILIERPDVGSESGSQVLEKVEGRVALRGVTFAYRDEPVLRGVDLEVEPGQTVAFVGPSGAGKSTAMDLIARFHDPSSGAIEIDGHDLRGVELASYRRHTALVSQQPFLFNDTIYANIVCARPGASKEDVERAAKAAQVHDFVRALPDGYETLCGERGSNLSGGQMQRITIARALLRDPRILFLDEATSALDSEAEEAVQHALNHLMKGRTSFVIAHRLSSVRNADLICVFEQGKIVERGSHAELAEAGGLYSRLLELQELR
ncbi:MAG: ABC transporter ATP-binding protein [Planctomycetota bacterium]